MVYVMHLTHHLEERRINFMEKKLEVKNLQVSFRTQGGILKAVRDISFDLNKGETLAIVGESGSGKSVTSKAIIGILAGNSIVEGGEILYDGQDLLKISEEDFHKIRGDKISMIFQDPLSSLNPIMRVGKQLTEAMILNGKARQKHATREFNSHLALLNKNLNEVNGNVKENSECCKIFDNFCIMGSKLELEYNDAQIQAEALKTYVENLAFLIGKNQKLDIKKELKIVLKDFQKSVHKFVVSADYEYEQICNEFNVLIPQGKNAEKDAILALLDKVLKVLEVSVKKEKPNYFRLGFYKLHNPDFDETSMPVSELDEMTKKYLEENFLLNFIELGSLGLKNSHDLSLKKKSYVLPMAKSFKQLIENSEVLNEQEVRKAFTELRVCVKDAVDYLSIHKRSVEYSFGISTAHELSRYFMGLKKNPISIRKYENSLRKYNQLIESGKNPTWKVIPPSLVDLELTKNNIVKIVENLIASYEEEIANADKFDMRKEMVELVDFFKEQASRTVYKVTQKLAKAKALDLLKEVGIPEPAIRYKQYPFEFSGGMRQRIVIAIALSANPDILICDEPTTALDVTIQSQILELINKIKKERDLAVIFITHDLGVVANMADRIAVMYAGKIVEYGTSEDVFYDPRHPYTWALLSSMPDLETKEKLEAIPGTPPNMIYPPKGDAFAERNKYALEIDFEQEPPLFEVSETHYAATWLLHPNAPKVNPPHIVTERIERMKKEAAK